MDVAVRRVFLVAVGLFLILIVNLTYLQVAAAPSLEKKPQNRLAVAQELRVRRGRILAWDGSVIAGVRKHSGFYYRTYPSGNLASHVVGYSSAVYGRSGIEESMNRVLSGRAAELGLRSWADQLLGLPRRGADVTLTLVPTVQREAQRQLAGKRGAIVVVNPTSGAVVASASAPSFSAVSLEKDWRKLRTSRGAPLLDRANQALYPPGSAFKVVTAASALDAGVVTPRTRFTDTGTYGVAGGSVVNYHRERFGQLDFTAALTHSVNTVFGRVGVELGREGLVEGMRAFGFWQRPPLELPAGQVATSGRYRAATLVEPDGAMDELAVAWAACGQEQVMTSPLQMALVAAAVANDGRLMRPYLVERVTDFRGRVISQAEPRVWVERALTPETAAALNRMMQQVVRAGTGTAAALAGIPVAGKTGTAETGRSTNQAWFIAFAPADAPRVAVAVTIEDTAATGGEVAAPLAAAVLRVALEQGRLP